MPEIGDADRVVFDDKPVKTVFYDSDKPTKRELHRGTFSNAEEAYRYGNQLMNSLGIPVFVVILTMFGCGMVWLFK